MSLIDDDGNLFGVINVVDALVIIMLLAVVVAGVALVTGSDTEPTGETATESETRYVTLELGTQPDYVVDRLSEGEVATIAGTDSTATLTDAHVTTPALNGTQGALVLVAIEGEVVADDHDRDVFHVDGEPLRLGTELGLQTGQYTANGTVTELSAEDETLGIESTRTTVDVELANVNASVADALSEGMTETARGEPVATIESIERNPATVIVESEDGDIYEREHPQNEDVTLTVELQTTATENGVQFRGDRLGAGTPIDLDFETVTVSGTVTGVE